jgi:hypothetical protein
MFNWMTIAYLSGKTASPLRRLMLAAGLARNLLRAM